MMMMMMMMFVYVNSVCWRLVRCQLYGPLLLYEQRNVWCSQWRMSVFCWMDRRSLPTRYALVRRLSAARRSCRRTSAVTWLHSTQLGLGIESPRSWSSLKTSFTDFDCRNDQNLKISTQLSPWFLSSLFQSGELKRDFPRGLAPNPV